MPWKLSEGVSISGGIVLRVDCHVLRIEGGEDADAHTEVAVRAGDRHSKKLPERPDNKTLLRIYLLYKQATKGDITAKRPGLTDLVGRGAGRFEAGGGQVVQRGDAGLVST